MHQDFSEKFTMIQVIFNNAENAASVVDDLEEGAQNFIKCKTVLKNFFSKINLNVIHEHFHNLPKQN